MALDATTGSERWRYAAPAAGEFHPAAFADGVVYAGSDSGGFVAVDAATGKLRWHADTGPDSTGATAVVADGTAYLSTIANATGHLDAFDAADGKLLWRLDEAMYAPAVSGGVAYSGSQTGVVSAHVTATGKELWRYEAKGPLGGPVSVAAGIVYVPAESGVYALDARTGAQLWQFDLDGRPTAIAVTHESVYVGTSPGSLYAIGSITSPARFLWQAKGDGDGLDFPNALALAPEWPDLGCRHRPRPLRHLQTRWNLRGVLGQRRQGQWPVRTPARKWRWLRSRGLRPGRLLLRPRRRQPPRPALR